MEKFKRMLEEKPGSLWKLPGVSEYEVVVSLKIVTF